MKVSWKTNRALADLEGHFAGLPVKFHGEPVFAFDGTMLFSVRFYWFRLPQFHFFLVNAPNLELRMRPRPRNRDHIMSIVYKTYMWTFLDAPLQFLFSKHIVPLLPSWPRVASPHSSLDSDTSDVKTVDVASSDQSRRAATLTLLVSIKRIVMSIRQKFSTTLVLMLGSSVFETPAAR